MMWRWRRLLYAGAGVSAVGIATLLALSAVTVEHSVAPTLQGGCYNVALDGGTLPTAPVDAGTEAGIRLYRVTIAGSAVIAPVTLQIFDGDLANKIDESSVATAGAWSRDLVLALGWHRLIFRVLKNGRSWETVRWVGLATAAPTWTAPSWSTEADGGARCWDAGCVPVGVVPRCSFGGRYQCSDGGCLDATNAFGPIGCVRGCGTLSPIPDAGCEGGNCPGRTDSGHSYRPGCCTHNVAANGLMRTPAYSISGVAGLSSEIAAQVTAGSKVTIASSSSADKNHDIYVYGIAGDGRARYEAIRTNGTTAVTGTLKWTTILGARESVAPAGTITMTSTTGGQTILTLSSAARTKGLRYVGSNQGALIGKRVLRVAADDATTDPVILVGTLGDPSFDGVTLAGTTTVQTAAEYSSLEWVAVGALDDAISLTISADEGWCTGGTFNNTFVGANLRGGEVLLNINFAGIAEPGGAGCGARHVMVMVGENKNAWPPPPRDAGYTFDAWRAATYPRWAYECRPRAPSSTTPTVPWNRDAGVAGTPYCSGNWCCVLARVYRVPDGGGL